MGPRVLEFERSFAKFVGAKHAVAVVNGTSALHASLLAADVGPGDEVILPSFTFVGAANAVVLTGATPVFADIDKDTYCLRIGSVEECVSRKTKAIIPTDLYGLPSDISGVANLARGKDIVVIEYAAQAHGAQFDGKKIGSIDDMTCFSFYAGKNITTGEGGMITTNDDGYAQALRMVRSHGEQRPYWTVRPGHNYHMTEIAAAIGYAQLKKLPSFLEKRRKNADLTTEKLNMTGKLLLPEYYVILRNLDDPLGVENVLDVWFSLFLQLIAYSNSRLGELDDSPNISGRRYHDGIAVYPSYGRLHVPDLLVTVPDSWQNLGD